MRASVSIERVGAGVKFNAYLRARGSSTSIMILIIAAGVSVLVWGRWPEVLNVGHGSNGYVHFF